MDFHLLIFLLFVFQSCTAIPRRGLEPWTLVLCKFRDLASYEPKSREWFGQWLSGQNEPDSIEQFFWQVSNGVYSIAGSNVQGWFTLPYTQNDVLRMVNSNNKSSNKSGESIGGSQQQQQPPLGSDTSFDYFDKVKELCVAEASRNRSITDKMHRQKITVINAGTAAVYGKKNGVLLTPQLMFSSVLTHEMVHSFFIGHSYSDRRIRVFPYASFGEYDDRYDLMSTANAYMHRSKFGMSGPGLNGAHLDYLGWLPMDRVLYFGRDGRQNYTLRLSSLSIPHNKTLGWLFVMIPFDRDDANNYYTVELRTPNQFDQGIGQPSILIHRVHRNGESYYSQLISQADFYELTDEGTEWVTFLEPLDPQAEKISDEALNSSNDRHARQNNGSRGDSSTSSNAMKNFQFIRISLKRIYAADADLHIVSTFNPSECRMGEHLYRSARWSQPYIIGLKHVCLTPANAAAENARNGSNIPPHPPPPLPIGNGAAVIPSAPAANINNENQLRLERHKRELRSIRVLNDVELRLQFARRNFFTLRRTFGANACRSGLVWRALDPYDYVCVTERRRDYAQREDQLQVERAAAPPIVQRPEDANLVGLGGIGTTTGSNTFLCAEPFLPRRAFPGDDICVSAAEKFRVFRENLQAYNTLLNVAFFNGLDTVGP